MRTRAVNIAWLALCLPLFLFTPLAGVNAQPVDSLEQVLTQAASDSVRIKIMLGYANDHYNAHPDYSLELATRGLKLAEKLRLDAARAQAQNLLGMMKESRGDYPAALSHYEAAYAAIEKLNKPEYKSAVLNNIGVIYERLKMPRQALPYYEEALAIDRKSGDSVGVAYALNNLGYLHTNIGDEKTALRLYKEALSIVRKLKLNPLEASMLHNIGHLFVQKKDFHLAATHLEQALKVARASNNVEGLARSTLEMARAQQGLGRGERALDLLRDCLKIAHGAQLHEVRQEALRELALTWGQRGNYRMADRYWRSYNDLRDSLLSFERERLTQEMIGKFESRSKDRKISDLQQQNELQRLKLRQERILRNVASAGGVLLLGLLAVLLFQYRQKRRANRVLVLQRQQLREQAHALVAANEEATAYGKELEQINQDLQKQHETVEHQHRAILDSLEYAYRIQKAMLPDAEELRRVFPDSFIFYRPKAIVSGDFYWIHVTPERAVIAAADCTGHGAPGAFMAVLGNSLLNQIVVNEGVDNPALALAELDRRVREHLHFQGNRSVGPASDGMEIALVTIDLRNGRALFCGANRPLYWLQAEGLEEVKGSKAVIGGPLGGRRESFTNFSIQLQEGDCLYMASDGYADQLGGPNLRRKYSTTRLKELLSANRGLSMLQQKMVLRREINEWRGRLNFVDDVMLIGLRYGRSNKGGGR